MNASTSVMFLPLKAVMTSSVLRPALAAALRGSMRLILTPLSLGSRLTPRKPDLELSMLPNSLVNIERVPTLTTPTATGSSLMPGAGHPAAGIDAFAGSELDGHEVLGVDFKHGEIVLLVHADELGLELTAILELAGDVAVQVVGFGQNPAVGTDDHAQGGFLAVAQNAHRAGARLGDDIAKGGDELRIGAEVFVFLRLRIGSERQGQEDDKNRYSVFRMIGNTR